MNAEARAAVIAECEAHRWEITGWEPVYLTSACATIAGGYVAANRWGDVVHASTFETMVDRLASSIGARLAVTS